MLKDFANLRSTFIGPSRAKLGISFTLKHHRWAIVSPLFALIWIYLKVLSTIKWLISVAFWKWAPQFENPFTKMKKKGAFVNERAGFQRSIYIFYCCKLCRQQWETLKLLKCRLALAEFVWHPFFLCPQSRMCNHRHLPSVLLTHFCYLSSRVQEETPPPPPRAFQGVAGDKLGDVGRAGSVGSWTTGASITVTACYLWEHCHFWASRKKLKYVCMFFQCKNFPAM